MKKSMFRISDMDCPAEESMVRMQLDSVEGVHSLRFDLDARTVDVFHSGDTQHIADLLARLDLGSTLQNTDDVVADETVALQGSGNDTHRTQSRLLWAVLIINFSFFLIESVSGFIAGSMGLVADSLDMLADSIVYALSLWAVGAAVTRKKRVATMSGYFQLTLAGIGFFEVIRRFVGLEAMPDFGTMIVVSTLALIANSICLYLLHTSRDEEAHMKASMIFTSNDVIINVGVIVAGILVLLTNSRYPDLIVGGIIFVVVLRGAFRILKLGRS
ncbi:MAG: cation transporter [Spirochaetaceae bacterium]